MPKLSADDQTARSAGLRRRRLTLASVLAPRSSSLAYNLSAVDANGRVVARTALAALGWSPGSRLDMRPKAGLIVVTTGQAGAESVTVQGNLRLPLLLRSWHRLVIHPLAFLDTVLGRFHAEVLDGGGEST